LSEGYEISTDISQKDEKCVIVKMDGEYLKKLTNQNIHKKQNELQFLFNLHSGKL
jgi:hypothetical protein